MSDLECWDCYVCRASGHFEACWKHATDRQRVSAAMRLSGLASQLGPHPLLRGRK